tara:strand:+ start:1398 stop:2330 length:933 start_codon:yes stop_codon:yes gene_type:complete
MKRTRPFDTRQLEAFDTLCATGSFTETAKRLLLTQSAISHSMRTLEDETGCQLIRRQGKKVSLTEAGERLLRFARPFLEEMSVVREELNGFEKFGAGRIRLGASQQACRFFLPPLVKEFKKGLPQCRFEVYGEDTPKCLNMLSLGELDLAISLKPIKNLEIEFVPCFSDELRIITTRDHQWAKNKSVDWSKVSGENFILDNRSSYSFRMTNEYLEQNGLKLTSFMEISSSDASKELIKLGLGIGIMANWLVADEVSSGELVSLPMGFGKLSRTWGISIRKGRKLNKAERIFIKIAEESGCHWMVNRRLTP